MFCTRNLSSLFFRPELKSRNRTLGAPGPKHQIIVLWKASALLISSESNFIPFCSLWLRLDAIYSPMGHTKPSSLVDLKEELEFIGALPSIRQKSPGIFYFKSVPFLHFHDENGNRWADVKINGKWQMFKICFAASKAVRATFVKDIELAHKKISGSKK
jgi:hypothetical protein